MREVWSPTLTCALIRHGASYCTMTSGGNRSLQFSSTIAAHRDGRTPMDQERSHKSYRPLTVATFKLTNMLYGMQPELFHLGNLVLHALACASFTWVLFDVFDDWKICLLSGILFAVHPIHTEAVSSRHLAHVLLCSILIRARYATLLGVQRCSRASSFLSRGNLFPNQFLQAQRQ